MIVGLLLGDCTAKKWSANGNTMLRFCYGACNFALRVVPFASPEARDDTSGARNVVTCVSTMAGCCASIHSVYV